MAVLFRGFVLSWLIVFSQAALIMAQARGPAKADVTAVVATETVRAGGDVLAALDVRLPEGFHVNSNKPRDPFLIPVTLQVTPPEGVTVEEIVWPESTDLQQAGASQPLRVFQRNFAIGVRLKVSAQASRGDLIVPASLRYQACDETTCYIPTRAETSWTFKVGATTAKASAAHAELFARIPFGHGEAPGAAPAPPPVQTTINPAADAGTTSPAATLDNFTVLGNGAGYLTTPDFLTFIHNAEAGIVEKGWFEGRGPIAILLLVLVGGLALNLTPCVLPMIPINLAIIGAGARAGSRGRGFLLGAAYGGAMAAVYGVLGLVVVLTAGTFGTINASPWFNLAIAALFVVLGLAMFEVIVIDFSRFSSGFSVDGSSRGSFPLAFGMGAVAALLAGACVAPVVVQVVLFSSKLYSGGTTLALALPFVLGIGMAAPWPFAGAGMAALPRPGAWMMRVNQVFGTVILAMAVYYGYEAYSLFANRWVDPSAVASSVEARLKEGWHSTLADGLAAAKRENKPVLVDMWATWCKNCLVMDQTTMRDPAVTSALAGYVKIKFQAENPDEPATKEVMQRFGAAGLPTYVILRPKAGG